MTAIDNIINQIEGETQNRGNTKTRIAAVLRLLRDKIANLFSDKLDKGTYSGNAGDLIGAIGNKVDKVPGKGLSTNDYTNQEKQTNQTNAQKRVVGVTVTGDVTKILTLTLADSSVLQTSFTDKDTLPNNLADVMLNSLNFNHDTGVLTGVRSDGQQLTVNLDGRYALLGHTHDDRYSRLGHTHSEYAYRTHRHHWDNIDGIPALATEGKIREEIEKIQVGGRNLLYNSRQLITNNSYNIATYQLTEELREGEVVTLTIKGQLGAGKTAFAPYNSGGQVDLGVLKDKGNGFYQNTFVWITRNPYGVADNKNLFIWTYSSNVVIDSTIEWIKLERGNTPTDWSPAPEDDTPVQRAGASINSNWTAEKHWQNGVIFVETSCNVELNLLENMSSMSFRKVFAGGSVTFTCAGKTIIYTGDNAFNGGDGSTAVVSVYGNKCYIDIRNV